MKRKGMAKSRRPHRKPSLAAATKKGRTPNIGVYFSGANENIQVGRGR